MSLRGGEAGGVEDRHVQGAGGGRSLWDGGREGASAFLLLRAISPLAFLLILPYGPWLSIRFFL